MPQKGKTNNPNGRPKGVKNRKPPIAVYAEELTGVIKGYSHYVYKHEYNKQCFYIGKGKGPRAWDKTEQSRNPEWWKFVNEINFDYSIRIVAMGITEKEALSIERVLIKIHNPKCNIDYTAPVNQLQMIIS